MRVKYHEAAEEELLHEIGYLEQRANGLGRRFRGRILRKFRCSLIYTMERDGLNTRRGAS